MKHFRISTAAVVAFMLGTLVSLRNDAVADETEIPQPTKEHKLLKHGVGTWDATMKIWTKPGAEPFESKAVEKSQLLPGGFWLLSRFDGLMGQMKFSGHGVFGYDPTEKKYIGTWIDNMNPHLFTMKGDYDEATKTLTMTGENRGPDGKIQKAKEVSRILDDDTRHFELHIEGDDGKFFKMMEVDYKRRPKEKKET